eukprot:246712_1
MSLKRDFFSHWFLLQHDNYFLNVRDKTSRRHAAQVMLSLLGTSNCIKDSLIISGHEKLLNIRCGPGNNVLCDILIFEWICDESAMCLSLSSIKDKLQKQRFACELMTNLNEIIDILTFNRLVLKYIFNSDDSKIWKYFLSAMLDAILLNVPKSQQELMILKDKTVFGAQDQPWLYCISQLTITIKYWTHKQFIFAINNGLCEILRVCWIKRLYVPFTQDKNISWSLYQNMYHYARQFDRKNDTEVRLHFMACFRATLGVSKKLYMKYLSDMEFSIHMPWEYDIFYKPRAKCGWLLCNKRKSQFQHKNKCGGCGLIQYCCRNHQKKHWKYMHSQQCLRLN